MPCPYMSQFYVGLHLGKSCEGLFSLKGCGTFLQERRDPFAEILRFKGPILHLGFVFQRLSQGAFGSAQL